MLSRLPVPRSNLASGWGLKPHQQQWVSHQNRISHCFAINSLRNGASKTLKLSFRVRTIWNKLNPTNKDRCWFYYQRSWIPMKTKYFFRTLRNRCPRCNQGAVLRTLFQRHEKCLSCDFEYSREDGFFIGGIPNTCGLRVPFELVTDLVLHVLVCYSRSFGRIPKTCGPRVPFALATDFVLHLGSTVFNSLQ